MAKKTKGSASQPKRSEATKTAAERAANQFAMEREEEREEEEKQGQPLPARPQKSRVMPWVLALLCLLLLAVIVALGYHSISASSRQTHFTAKASAVQPELPNKGLTRISPLRVGGYSLHIDGRSEIFYVSPYTCITTGNRVFTFWYYPHGATEAKKYTGGDAEFDRFYVDGTGQLAFEVRTPRSACREKQEEKKTVQH